MNKIKTGLIETSWNHIRRLPFQSLSAILVLWLNFLTATILIVLVLLFNSLLNYFESRPEIIVFLKDKAVDSQIQQLKQKITQLNGIKEVKFVPKEEALKIYKDLFKDNPLSLEMVSASILPASLEISAIKSDYLIKVIETIKNDNEVIEKIVFQKDIIERLSFWIKSIKNIGFIIVGFLFIVSLMIITVIIGMKIAVHKEEISSLRSLGASNFYIEIPFLIEGAFYGLVGSFTGAILVFLNIFLNKQKIENFFNPIIVISDNSVFIILMIFIIEVIFGCFWGLIASFLATRRFIKK